MGSLNKDQLVAAITAIKPDAVGSDLLVMTNDDLRAFLTSVTPEPTPSEGGQEIEADADADALTVQGRHSVTTKAGIKVGGSVITEDMLSGGAKSIESLKARGILA